MARVFISYGHLAPDEALAAALDDALTAAGHEVFIDTRIPIGREWGDIIEQHLGSADWLIALVSAMSISSPMVVTEIEAAHQRNRASGRPSIIPIRIGDCPRLRYPLSAYLNRFQQGTLTGPDDTARLIERIRETLATPRARLPVARQRQALIQRVRTDWIKGILERSLYHMALIELGLSLEGARVVRGLDTVVQRPDETPTPLPPATRLIDVLDEHQQQLLILGAPGSGKTTLLLELASELLDRADHEEEHPVPVVFNLSSWALERLSLDHWMISELILRSDAPKKLAHEWVTNEQILPLLDGFDEVAVEHRAGCLAAINAYRREHGWVPIVVCSRTAEYEALTERLNVPAAVVVQPLSRGQIATYLESSGEPLAAVREALGANSDLWEMLQTPLMLSIVALAYQHAPAAPAPRGPQEVLGRYVDAMFRRRARETRFSEESMRFWLQWLASNMVRRRQTVFFLEDVVPEWILGSTARWFTVVTIAISAISAFGWMYVLAGTLAYFASREFQVPRTCARRSPERGLGYEPALCALVAVFVAVRHAGRSSPVETLRLTLPGWLPLLAAGIRGALFGFSTGTAFGYVGWLVIGAFAEDVPRMIPSGFGLEAIFKWAVVGAIVISVFSIARALFVPTMSTQQSEPGGLLRRSVASASTIFGVTLLLALPFFRASPELTHINPGMTGIVFTSLSMLSFGGLLFAFERGGYFAIRHYLARLVLWWKRWAPWDYAAFLEAADQRIVLRRVGGGYIFVHRMLMEHLADGTRATVGSDRAVASV